MAVSESGVSTLGIKLGYAKGTGATSSDKPSAFTWLERANEIGGIELSTETIDSSALEDFVSKSIAGRQNSGDTWSIIFNYTTEVATQLETMITAYKSYDKTQGECMWMEVFSPSLTNGFYVIVEPPKVIPMPEFSQNGLLTVELQFAINDYIGALTKVEPV